MLSVCMFISFLCIFFRQLDAWQTLEKEMKTRVRPRQSSAFFVTPSRAYFIEGATASPSLPLLRRKVTLTVTHIQRARRAFVWWEHDISLQQFKRIRLQFIGMKLQDGGRSVSQPLLLSLRVVSICIPQIASRWEASERWRFLSPAGSACGEAAIFKSVW